MSNTMEIVVVGPPGCGKSTWVKRQVENASRTYNPKKIMLASFSRGAAHVLRDKAPQVPASNANTLHAFAFHALGEPELTQGNIKEFNEAHPSYRLSGSDDDSLDEANIADMGGTEADRLMMLYQNYRARMIDRKAWSPHVNAFARVWEGWKQEAGLFDFTDLLEKSIENVDAPLCKPEIAFYDEAQDFAPLEFKLARKWAKGLDTVVFIGDPNQAIYSFKGVDPRSMSAGEITAGTKRVLAQSYRVPEAVRLAATDWLHRASFYDDSEYKPRKDENGEIVPGKIRRAAAITAENPTQLLRLIEADLTAGKSVMLMASCGYMLRKSIGMLKSAGLPFHNPYRKSKPNWNPLNPPKGVSTANRLLAFLRPAPELGEQSAWYTYKDIGLWAESLIKEAFLTGKKKIATGFDSDDPAEIIDLLGAFSPEAVNFFTEPDITLADRLNWLEKHLVASKAGAFEFPLAVTRRAGPGALKEEPRVMIGTIHSFKGGEADSVYLFPDLSQAGMLEWMKPGEGRDSTIRMFYVAMTRAKETLTICGPSGVNAVTGLIR